MKILLLLKNGIKKGNFSLYLAGGAFIFYTVFITLGDVVGRYFRKPIPGALETCELALVAMVFFTLAHTQAERGHVSIDLLFTRFPRRIQGMLDVITSFLGLFLAVLIAWAAIPYVLDSRAGTEITDLLHIPLYPFKFLIFIGALALSCQLILDVLDSYRRIRKHRHGNNT